MLNKFSFILSTLLVGHFSLAIVGGENDSTFIATNTSQLGQNSILTTKLSVKNQRTIPSCPSENPSPALARSLVHLMGFTEIRDYISQQSNSGLSICYSGLTLGKNTYQYYKNLIFIKFFNNSNKLVKLTTLMFQSSSIQGHHSPEGRPWVTLSSRHFNELVWGNIFNEQIGLEYPMVETQFSAEKAVYQIPGNKDEVSSLFLFTKEGVNYFLVSWLQDVTATNAGIYASQVSPKYAIFKQKLNSAEAELIKKSNAFNSILIPSEELLEKASADAYSLPEHEQLEFIDELSTL